MATRTISVAGGNWSANGTWDEGAKPVAGDAVVARGGGDSGNVTIDVASATASIILTNYTGTLTFNNTLTVTSTVTFVSGMTIAGTSNLICNGSLTITSGGKTLTGGLTLQNTQTYTFADAAVVTGLLTVGTTSGTTTLTGSTLSVAGGITQNQTTGIITGSTVVTMTGGIFTGPTSTGAFRNSLTFAGNVTISSSQTFRYNTGTMTYTSGTITTTGSTLTSILGTTWNVNGITWNNVTMQGSGVTHTFNSNMACSGLLNWGNSSESTTFTGQTVSTSGGFRYAGTSGVMSGTTIVALTGTGTVDAPSITSGSVKNQLNINAPGGTITFTSVINFDLGQIKLTAGTVTTTHGAWSSGTTTSVKTVNGLTRASVKTRNGLA